MPTADFLLLTGHAAEEAGNFEIARQSFERAGILGDSTGWTRLAYMYDNGIGCEIDKAYAMRCYKKAWRMRDDIAANNIAILYREAGKRRAMFQWFKRAAEMGDDDALVQVAKCLVDGVGVRKDTLTAMCYLAEATVSNRITESGREEAEELLSGLRPRSVPAGSRRG
jgi:TPR repeat protein